MAYENCMSITLNAATGADVRQRRFVTVGASGIGEAVDGADAVGVSLELYDDSERALGNATTAIPVVVNQGARVELIAGEAIAIGDDIASDSQGRAKTSATGDAILGKALTASSAAGTVVDVLYTKAGRQTT